mmetsp:Transcript_20751/g.37474  ORF Transcript_20751/g.37474 Transcript_20751/m.37474 type:complete len:221 (+) Transcript_20751:151-813(+)
MHTLRRLGNRRQISQKHGIAMLLFQFTKGLSTRTNCRGSRLPLLQRGEHQRQLPYQPVHTPQQSVIGRNLSPFHPLEEFQQYIHPNVHGANARLEGVELTVQLGGSSREGWFRCPLLLLLFGFVLLALFARLSIGVSGVLFAGSRGNVFRRGGGRWYGRFGRLRLEHLLHGDAFRLVRFQLKVDIDKYSSTASFGSSERFVHCQWQFLVYLHFLRGIGGR